jgi:hypothetical protein
MDLLAVMNRCRRHRRSRNMSLCLGSTLRPRAAGISRALHPTGGTRLSAPGSARTHPRRIAHPTTRPFGLRYTDYGKTDDRD